MPKKLTFINIVMACGLIFAGAALIYVPHTAEYIRTGDNYRSHIGYSLIWDPPSRDEACKLAFRASSGSYCRVHVDNAIAIQTSVAFLLFALGVVVIAGVAGRPAEG